MPQKEKSDFLKTWGVLIASVLIQVGGYIAVNDKLKEDVKKLVLEMSDMQSFKSAYTVKFDTIFSEVERLRGRR